MRKRDRTNESDEIKLIMFILNLRKNIHALEVVENDKLLEEIFVLFVTTLELSWRKISVTTMKRLSIPSIIPLNWILLCELTQPSREPSTYQPNACQYALNSVYVECVLWADRKLWYRSVIHPIQKKKKILNWAPLFEREKKKTSFLSFYLHLEFIYISSL